MLEHKHGDQDLNTDASSGAQQSKSNMEENAKIFVNRSRITGSKQRLSALCVCQSVAAAPAEGWNVDSTSRQISVALCKRDIKIRWTPINLRWRKHVVYWEAFVSISKVWGISYSIKLSAFDEVSKSHQNPWIPVGCCVSASCTREEAERTAVFFFFRLSFIG